MNKENLDLHNLCELNLLEDNAPEMIIDPDDEETKDYLSAIKSKKRSLVTKMRHKAPSATQEQVDKRNEEYEQRI